jgi:uncharacterized membrane protein (DUF4010 family)
MMFPRVLVEVLVVHRPLISRVILPIGAMLVTGWAVFALLWRRERFTELSDEGTIELTNPLNLSTAITFGLVFAVVLVATKAANRFLGTAGVYAASVIAGVTDVDSITLSVSELAANGQIEPQVASLAIILAALTNTVAKGAMALILGSRKLRPIIIRAFGAMVLVGIISATALFWFGTF